MKDVYPIDSLQHLTPLVLISGLDIPESEDRRCLSRLWSHSTKGNIENHPLAQNGEQLITTRRVKGLEEENVIMPELFWKFANKSTDIVNWNPHAIEVSRRQAPYLLNIQFLKGDSENEFTLPAVKKHIPIQTPNAETSNIDTSKSLSRHGSENFKVQYPSGSSHSPISPLTPGSDLYPDGLMSVQWLQKYLYLVPSTFISLHLLDTNAKTKEEEEAADEKLTNRINHLKAQLSKRNIKLVVIIVSDALPSVDPNLNDRIYYLRKNVGLAARTGMFFLPPSTEIELETLAETVCQLSFTAATEFYSSIAREVRRKRGGRPKALSAEDAAGINTSPLSNAGWEIRYSYKLGALAEFRQELESASKAYEVTYEMATELFETLHPLTETTAQRWKEYRMFLDVVAYHIIKLYFYSGLPHVGYKKFLTHLNSVGNILESKQKFSKKGFSYKNWRATQYALLAELVIESQIKFEDIPVDQFTPGDCLPRCGNLYLTAVQLWVELLDGNYEDSKDPYMNKDSSDMKEINTATKEALSRAIKDFSQLKNNRTIGYTYYLLGETYLLYDKDLKKAQEYYKLAAQSYRQEKWKSLLNTVLKRLLETSLAIGDTYQSSLSELEYNLYNDKIEPSVEEKFNQLSLDDDELKTVSDEDTKNYRLDLYSANFTFEQKESFLGLHSPSQLVLQSKFPVQNFESQSKQASILEDVLLTISGQLPSIHIVHNGDLPFDDYIELHNLEPEDDSVDFEDRILKGEANLTFNPGQKRILEFENIPKKLGEASVISLKVIAKYRNLRLNLDLPLFDDHSGASLWYDKVNLLKPRFIKISDPFKIILSPRPSKVFLSLSNKGPFAIGEKVMIFVKFINEEPQDVIIESQVKSSDKNGDVILSNWVEDKKLQVTLKDLKLPKHGSKEIQLEVQIPSIALSNFTVEFYNTYYSVSDSETLVKDNVSFSIPVQKPFVVNFDINPRYHTKNWSSFFIPSHEDGETGFGITPRIWKKWELSSSVLCLTEKDSVDLIGSDLEIITPDNVTCDLVEKPKNEEPINLDHNDRHRISYIIDTARSGESEVRQVTAEAHLKLFWKRKDSEVVNEFKISPVRLNLPIIEPRVIVSKYTCLDFWNMTYRISYHP